MPHARQEHARAIHDRPLSEGTHPLTDLPAGILMVLTALAGANIALAGLLLLLGQLTLADLEAGHASDGVPVWATFSAVVLAIGGMVVQSRGVSRDKRMRAAWAG